MKQKIMLLLAGVVLGMALVSAGPAAASNVLTAVPSSQAVYVDGQRVSMTAYNIGGANYVKLRDVGQLVGFNVYWDGTVQIRTDQPYTGVAPASPSTAPVQQAPAVLTEESVQTAIKALKEVYPTPYIPNNPLDRPFTNCDHCAGWAMLCSDAAFGDLPWRKELSPAWEDIKVGDLVRYSSSYGGHVVVVTDKTDEYIFTTESSDNNKVRWGGQYFKWWLETQPGYAR